MEKIQSHEIKDIWRVREGLLVEVWKYESLGYSIYNAKGKVIKGCKGLRKLTEDYIDKYFEKTYPKGTLIYNYQPVKAITDKSKFKVDIKSSGGSILGDFAETKKALEDIEYILNQY